MIEIALAPSARGRAQERLGARRRFPLAVKLAAALVGLVALVLLVNGAINMWLSYGEAKDAALGVQQEKAQAAAQRVGEFIAEIENQIGWTTRLEWSRVPLEQQRYDFARLLRQVPALTEVSYLDGKGKEQLKVSRLEPDVIAGGRDFSNEPRFTKAIADKVWFSPVYFRRGSEPYMTVAVAHAGHDSGVTAAEVNLKLIWDVITNIRVGQKGYAYVVDGKGRLVAHPDLSLVLRDTDFSQLPQVRQALERASVAVSDLRPTSAPSAENAEIATAYEGGSVLTAQAEVSRLNWYVFVQLPLAEAMAPVYASLIQTLTLLGLGLLLALVAGSYLARRMVVPIRRLQEGAERLGGGDLTQRIDINTGDEIETLADRFNQMAGRVQESHETLEAKVKTRTKDLDESLQQQTATAEVLKVISRSTFDAQAVLQTLVQTASRLCAAEFALIFELREGKYHLAAANNATAGFVRHAAENPISLGRASLIGRTALEKKIVQIPDCLSDPEYSFSEYQRSGQYRSMLGVPLMRENVAIGVIGLLRTNVSPFTDKQIELVSTFADQAAIAIENARLINETNEALERQTATAEVLRVINGSPGDLAPVFEAILQKAHSLCGVSVGSLQIYDGEKFRAVAVHGFAGPFADHLREGYRPGPNLPHRRLLEGARFAQVSDLAAIDDPIARKAVELSGIRTLLCVALRKDDALLGQITAARLEVRSFSEKEVALLESFGAQAVIAMENARLITETREALQQQTATAEVLKVISRSTFHLQTVLDTLVASAARLCEAQKAAIMQRDESTYRWVAHYGFPDELVQYALRHPFAANANSTTGRVALEGKPVQITDVLADPNYTALEYQRLGNFRTILGVPLLREGAPIGVFVLTRDEVRPFNQRQIELLQTFADQAVIAIENVRLFDETQARTKELATSIEDLRAAQNRLVQSEKLASLGQLTAGIAHEIKNPLNFVNNFASLSRELIEELKPLVLSGAQKDKNEIEELMQMLGSNLEKVMQHGKRADLIVKNMLLHSRESSGEHRLVDLNALVEESVNLAYHGARAEKPGFNITLTKELDPQTGDVDVYPQEFTRVILNLISNGFYAALKRKSELGDGFEPTLTASTRNLGDKVEIRIRDNGIGIPEDVKAKMFNPFFTTKPAGEGTGLGLSLSYDIVVKQHGGTIQVDTKPGDFTEFTIVLPRGGNPKSSEGRP